MPEARIARYGPEDLQFVTWHDAPDWARRELLNWVGGMTPWRDGELGGTPWGALKWLEQKIALSPLNGLLQTFLALCGQEVVWTGSVVEDDRDVKARLAAGGLPVDGFFGLFNTRYDRRGRGIGWTGASHVNDHVQRWADRSASPVTIALFTGNPAAERHYRDLGFRPFRRIFIPDFSVIQQAYYKNYHP